MGPTRHDWGLSGCPGALGRPLGISGVSRRLVSVGRMIRIWYECMSVSECVYMIVIYIFGYRRKQKRKGEKPCTWGGPPECPLKVTQALGCFERPRPVSVGEGTECRGVEPAKGSTQKDHSEGGADRGYKEGPRDDRLLLDMEEASGQHAWRAASCRRSWRT